MRKRTISWQSLISLLNRYGHINWALADQALISGANFLTGVLLARYLGIAEFGRFTLVWMVAQVSNSVQQSMIVLPMMSLGPQQSEQEKPGYYGAVLALQVGLVLLSFLLLVGGVLLIGARWDIQTLAVPLAFAAGAFRMQDSLRRYFFARRYPARAFLNDAVSYGSQIGLLFWLFRVMTLDTGAVLWIIATTSMLACGVGFCMLARVAWRPENLPAVFRRHWHFAKWLTGTALVQWAAAPVFLFAAGAILGTAAVGAIRACQNILGPANILFQSFENVVPARAAAHYYRSGKPDLSRYIIKVMWSGGILIGALAVFLVIWPEAILKLMYGADYVGYEDILRWAAILRVLAFMALPLQVGLRALEHTRPIFTSYSYVAMLSLIIAYPLTKLLGIHGVMLGYLIIGSVYVALLIQSYRKYNRGNVG